MELNHNSGGEGRGQLDLATGVGTGHRLYQCHLRLSLTSSRYLTCKDVDISANNFNLMKSRIFSD